MLSSHILRAAVVEAMVRDDELQVEDDPRRSRCPLLT
jgi:hypothetical protein